MAQTAQHKTDFKETLTSIIIAFVMAFLFRGFVVEGFIIPTGSMAPTLRGQHHQFRSPDTGYEWAVGPPQRAEVRGVDVNSGREFGTRYNARAGDRIFVMKYLYSIYDPKRFDPVVFKNPTDPTQNFIKRLIGLPNEQLALIDGDVFVRTPRPDDPADVSPWLLPGWTVVTKPQRVQRELWQLVFDSQFTPISPTINGRTWTAPWKPAPSGEGAAAFTLGSGGVYSVNTDAPARLDWDSARHPIFDTYSYNVRPEPQADFLVDPAQPSLRLAGGGVTNYPVSDLRMSLAIRPETSTSAVAANIESRRHHFRCEIQGSSVVLKMRALSVPNSPLDPPWTTLATATLPRPLPAGQATPIEFWHVDQTLQVWIDGEQVAHATYAWSPDERVQFALGKSVAQIMATPGNLMLQESLYSRPRAYWEFAGSKAQLFRVRLDRDIHYQASQYSGPSVHGVPALATHPSTTLETSGDQFFCCGDNSPSSLDGRLWDSVSPWVRWVEPRVGVVHRDLMIGKAFFCYLPAPQWPLGIPMFDLGQTRWVW